MIIRCTTPTLPAMCVVSAIGATFAMGCTLPGAGGGGYDEAGVATPDGGRAPGDDPGTPSGDATAPGDDSGPTERDARPPKRDARPDSRPRPDASDAGDPSDPATRTKSEVCTRWNAEFPERARTISTPPVGCVPAPVTDEAHDDAIRRLNLYRWLVGLRPVTPDSDNRALADEAALIMDANDRLIRSGTVDPHHPQPSWKCYSSRAARTASRSNLIVGSPSPADSVEGYVGDKGVESLGHRRWCLYPQLDKVGFGHVRRGGAMYVAGTGAARSPKYVAYPGPGPFPTVALPQIWSFARPGALGGATATVTAVSTGADFPVEVAPLMDGLPWAAIGITPSSPPVAGETYRVEVTAGGETIRYEVKPVDCGA